MLCPYCGSETVFDGEYSMYVCPSCGLVIDYEMVPSFSHLSHTYPLPVRRRIPEEVAGRAEEELDEELGAELRELRRLRAGQLAEAIRSVVRRRDVVVDPKLLRAVAELARSQGLGGRSLSEIRAEQVRAEIRRLAASCCPGVDPEDVYSFAVRHRDLWSGRRPETVASVFLYLYSKLRTCTEPGIQMKPNTKKLAKLFERILAERGEGC